MLSAPSVYQDYDNRDGVERADRVLNELGLLRREISSVRLIDSGYIAPQDGRGGAMLMRAEAFDTTTPVEAGTSSAEARVELKIRY